MFVLSVATLMLGSQTLVHKLTYRPAPVDNPLKGLVPYSGEPETPFPHSMEFNYVPLKDLMPARGKYDWAKLEELLNDVASRGHQTIFRIWVEYPGEASGLPAFLRQEGVRVTTHGNEDDKSKKPNFTPDYRNPKLQSAFTEFIGAMGKRYDGDPRIGYITAGLLGMWGEWHTYPREDLGPPPALQAKVMDAYDRAFRRTPVLLRYPADKDSSYAPNRDRRFGYHDDSFAWATLDTGKPGDSWYYMALLKKAGATEKWKRFPIGGEIRPEAWGQVFDAKPKDPQIQDFRACVDQTHATWLMDSGMFSGKHSPERVTRAKREVARMGYEFTITQVKLTASELEVTVQNRGVAPFYHDWPVELASLSEGVLSKPWRPGWRLTGILPGVTSVWRTPRLLGSGALLLRVPNPMPKGHTVRFGNVEQDQDLAGWITLSGSRRGGMLVPTRSGS